MSVSTPPALSPTHASVASGSGARRPAAATVATSRDEVLQQTASEPSDSGKSGFSFWDLVDIINPLQHIPVVSTIYRQVTGDEIKGFARVAGGALFGGLAGAGLGVLNAAMVDNTHKDLGDTIVSAVMGDDDGANGAAVAASDPVAQTSQGFERAAVSADPTQASSSAATAALFDPSAETTGSNGAAVRHARGDTAPSVPVIEVRPSAATQPNAVPNALPDALPNALPPARSMTSLPPVTPDRDSKTSSAAEKAHVQKAHVQQAMMDALLKMQALHTTTDDDQTSENITDGPG